mmetsp:Transcript_2975/g.6632  ORF Transcript_2975/g.6632 Transcript_2975/m.6632 type:complete len:125 (-) Transcript_2975:411-785(-)
MVRVKMIVVMVRHGVVVAMVKAIVMVMKGVTLNMSQVMWETQDVIFSFGQAVCATSVEVLSGCLMLRTWLVCWVVLGPILPISKKVQLPEMNAWDSIHRNAQGRRPPVSLLGGRGHQECTSSTR